MERVLGVVDKDYTVVFPFWYLKTQPLVQVSVGDLDLLIISKAGMASAVDEKRISQSKDILAAVAFSRIVDGKLLDFEWQENVIEDRQTHSTWTMFGKAISD